MIDTAVSFLIIVPAVFSTFMILFIVAGFLCALLFFVTHDSEAGLQFVFDVTQLDSPPFNAIILSGTLLCLSIIGKFSGIISISTVDNIFGMFSIVSLWYFIYLVDVWKTMYHDYRVKKDSELLKQTGNTK